MKYIQIFNQSHVFLSFHALRANFCMVKKYHVTSAATQDQTQKCVQKPKMNHKKKSPVHALYSCMLYADMQKNVRAMHEISKAEMYSKSSVLLHTK